jgi:hypothetical protein
LVRSNVVRFLNQVSACYKNKKKNLIWLLNSNNGKFILITPGKFFFDKLNICVSFYRNDQNYRIYFNFLKKNLITHWTRVSFRGKSYRVKCFKKIKKFTFNFGYSHWTKFKAYSYNWSFFRKRRQSYLIFTYNFFDIKFFKRILPTVRTYNPYTMRGLRLKKQAIIRRFGKISQHISILH